MLYIWFEKDLDFKWKSLDCVLCLFHAISEKHSQNVLIIPKVDDGLNCVIMQDIQDDYVYD